jgi:general secretion pathway protein K
MSPARDFLSQTTIEELTRRKRTEKYAEERLRRVGSMRRKSSAGIALFVIMSALAILTIIVAELSYSTHMQSRLAYNHIDGLKAFYNAKAGFKLGLLRLNLYKQVKDMLSQQNNSAMAQMVGPNLIEKIWSFPFFFPVPVTDEMGMTQKDAIDKFTKSSSLEGEFQINIKSLGSKLNLNQLLVRVAEPNPSPSASPSPANQSQPGQPVAQAQPTPQPNASPTEVDFKPVAHDMLNQQLNLRRETDREFAETYRDVTGQDIVSAIMMYVNPNPDMRQRPNLPGAEEIIPKGTALYSLQELHMIEGIDDTLYDLIEPHFTVYSTPGININMADKQTLWGLIPEFTQDDLIKILEMRDHPDTGTLFASEDKFWEALGQTSVSNKVPDIKERLQKAGIKIITSEKSFLISVESRVGLAKRTIEAYVTLSTQQNNSANNQQQPAQPAAPANTNQQQNQDPNNAQNASTARASGINLVYWRLR